MVLSDGAPRRTWTLMMVPHRQMWSLVMGPLKRM